MDRGNALGDRDPRRANQSCDFGPGISVTSLRSCGMSMRLSSPRAEGALGSYECPRPGVALSGVRRTMHVGQSCTDRPCSARPRPRWGRARCTFRTIEAMAVTVRDIVGRSRACRCDCSPARPGPTGRSAGSMSASSRIRRRGSRAARSSSRRGWASARRPAKQRAYVKRLAGAGTRRARVRARVQPRQDPAVARSPPPSSAGFPLFEVPYPVPFIAITEAVFTPDRGRAVRHAAARGRCRARAHASRPGGRRASRASPRSLADVTEGWVLLLDLHGLPMATTGRAATVRAERVWDELRESASGGDVVQRSRWSIAATTSGSSRSAPRGASRRSSRWASPSSRAIRSDRGRPRAHRCSRSSSRSPGRSPTRNAACRATSSTSSRAAGLCTPMRRAGASRGSASSAGRPSSWWPVEGGDDPEALALAVDERALARRRRVPRLAARRRGVHVLVPAGPALDLAELAKAVSERIGCGRASGERIGRRAGRGRAIPPRGALRAAGLPARGLAACRIRGPRHVSAAPVDDRPRRPAGVRGLDAHAARRVRPRAQRRADRSRCGLPAAQRPLGDGRGASCSCTDTPCATGCARSRSSRGATCRAASTAWSSGSRCGPATCSRYQTPAVIAATRRCPSRPTRSGGAASLGRVVRSRVFAAYWWPDAEVRTGVHVRPRRGTMADSHQMFIDGEWVNSSDGGDPRHHQPRDRRGHRLGAGGHRRGREPRDRSRQEARSTRPGTTPRRRTASSRC